MREPTGLEATFVVVAGLQSKRMLDFLGKSLVRNYNNFAMCRRREVQNRKMQMYKLSVE